MGKADHRLMFYYPVLSCMYVYYTFYLRFERKLQLTRFYDRMKFKYLNKQLLLAPNSHSDRIRVQIYNFQRKILEQI